MRATPYHHQLLGVLMIGSFFCRIQSSPVIPSIKGELTFNKDSSIGSNSGWSKYLNQAKPTDNTRSTSVGTEATDKSLGIVGNKTQLKAPHSAEAEIDEISPTTTSSDLLITASSVPIPCESDTDAIGKIRNEIFVFKQQYFWRYDDQGLQIEEPIEIDRFWYGLPDNLNHVDAVYEDTKADVIYFFIGRQYWEFSGNFAPSDFPKSIGNFGFPKDVERIDAAFQWSFNQKFYFFSGDKYWALDPATNKTELDYPRLIKNGWKGVPNDLDAAFSAHDGSTFFVKGKDIYKFDNKFSQVQNGWPQPYTSFWTECGQDYATFGALKQRKVHTEPSFTPVSSASIQSSEISNILTRCQLTFLIIYAGLSFYQ